jgi:hypothetical protein
MVLLKRILEGFRVHSCVAACTADLQELYLSQSGSFCCFDSPTTVSEQHVCKLVLAMECYCNEGSWLIL